MTQDWRDIPYSKGFLLTKQRLSQVAHYEPQTLPGGWHLWTDTATSTELATWQDDFLAIRGHWIDTSDDASPSATAEQLLSDMRTKGELAFHRRLSRLGGRYVIIVKIDQKLRVYHDATGLRSVYYSTVTPLVGSHLNLLLELQAQEPQYSYKETIHALDATPYSKLRQLLPNFRLDPERNEVERFYPFERNRYSSISPEQRLAHVEKLWRRVMAHYISLTDKLTLSLTGGLDSKLMLAMCQRDSSKFVAYTYGMTERSDAPLRVRMG
jgi:asparagine synthetase B (glutamine-hydrolysing)